MTYFIIHQLEVIKKSIADLHRYLADKAGEVREDEKNLKKSKLNGLLNQRQLGLLKNSLDNPGTEYTIKSHQNSHGTAYQTARTDLLALADKYHLLKKYKIGKKDVFIAPANMLNLIKK